MKNNKRRMKRKQRSSTGAAVAGMLMLLMSLLLAVVSPQRAMGGVKGAVVAAFEQGVQSYMEFEEQHATLEQTTWHIGF